MLVGREVENQVMGLRLSWECYRRYKDDQRNLACKRHQNVPVKESNR